MFFVNVEVDDYERHNIDDGDEGEATIAVGQVFVLSITVRRLGHEGVQHVVPARRGDQPAAFAFC